jgi:hypothetical protein
VQTEATQLAAVAVQKPTLWIANANIATSAMWQRRFTSDSIDKSLAPQLYDATKRGFAAFVHSAGEATVIFASTLRRGGAGHRSDDVDGGGLAIDGGKFGVFALRPAKEDPAEDEHDVRRAARGRPYRKARVTIAAGLHGRRWLTA